MGVDTEKDIQVSGDAFLKVGDPSLVKRPLIGVAGRQAAQTDDPDVLVARGNYHCLSTYIDAISELGGLPVIIPPLENAEIFYEDLFRRGGIDGLLLPGGCDVDPKLYEGARTVATGVLFPQVDNSDFALLNLAQRFRIPVLGICRGMQVINVWRGGCLKDVSTGHDFHDRDRRSIEHILRLAAGSRLAKLASGEVGCNSLHHQICDILGTDLIANCWAGDNAVEGLEWEGSNWWVVAVQCHPEELWRDSPTWRSLFMQFLHEAADTKHGPDYGRGLVV